MRRTARIFFHLLGCDGFYHFCRTSQKYRTIRGNRLAGNQCPCADDAVIADDSACQHQRTHANQGVIPHSTTMDDGTMTNGAVFAQCGFLMKHAPVLNICAFSHSDSAAVAPQNCAVPDIYIVAQYNVPRNDGIRGNIDLFLHHSTPCFFFHYNEKTEILQELYPIAAVTRMPKLSR